MPVIGEPSENLAVIMFRLSAERGTADFGWLKSRHSSRLDPTTTRIIWAFPRCG